jgi:hypothetical protein
MGESSGFGIAMDPITQQSTSDWLTLEQKARVGSPSNKCLCWLSSALLGTGFPLLAGEF